MNERDVPMNERDVPMMRRDVILRRDVVIMQRNVTLWRACRRCGGSNHADRRRDQVTLVKGGGGRVVTLGDVRGGAGRTRRGCRGRGARRRS